MNKFSNLHVHGRPLEKIKIWNMNNDVHFVQQTLFIYIMSPLDMFIVSIENDREHCPMDIGHIQESRMDKYSSE